MVLDAGEIAEFGNPWELLQQPESMLSKMVKQMGTESEDNLRAVANARWLKLHHGGY